MMKRNTVSFESMRVGSADTLNKAVTEAPSLWRTYYLPEKDNMVGDKVDQYDPMHTQILVNYEIHPDVRLGGFYTGDDPQNLRFSQTSLAGTVPTQETPGLHLPSVDGQASMCPKSPNPVAPSKSDDDLPSLMSHSVDNDVCSPHCSLSDQGDEFQENGWSEDGGDINEVSSRRHTLGKEKEHFLEPEERGFRVQTRSERAAEMEAQKEAALRALESEKQRRDERRQSHRPPLEAPELLSTHDEEVIEMSQREVVTQELEGLAAVNDFGTVIPRLPAAQIFTVGENTIAASLQHELRETPAATSPDSMREARAEALPLGAEKSSHPAEPRKLIFSGELSPEKALVDVLSLSKDGMEVDRDCNLGEVVTPPVSVEKEQRTLTPAVQVQHVTQEPLSEDGADVHGTQQPRQTPNTLHGVQEEVVEVVGLSNCAMPPLEAPSAAKDIEMSEREEARRAEEAWRAEAEKVAKKRAKEKEDLERENQLFLKKFAKPPPDRIVLHSDSSDEEDEIVRARLLRRYNCVLPRKGTRAVNRAGHIHFPVVVQPEKPDPEPLPVPNPSHPTSSGPASASHSFQPLSLEEEIFRDVKTELVEERWMRKRKAEIDLELTERVNKKFAESKQDLLKSIYDDFHAGRVPFPFPEPSSRPGNRSEIHSGISNAGTPIVPPLVIPASTAPVIPDPSIPLVSPIFIEPEPEIVPCTPDPLLLSQFDGKQDN